jgi:hypothetical protein
MDADMIRDNELRARQATPALRMTDLDRQRSALFPDRRRPYAGPSRRGLPHETDDRDFAELTDLVHAIAREHSGGRVVSVLEGGYSLHGLSHGVAAHLGRLGA